LTGVEGISLLPIAGIPEVRPGHVLAELIIAATSNAMSGEGNGPQLLDGDVIVVTQKVVSKAEGRLVAVDPDKPDDHKRLVLDEAVRVIRRRKSPKGELLVTQTRHGFVCANSGVDLSNVEMGYAALLPLDSDRSARRIRDGIRGRLGLAIGVVISDTFGRTWRRGLTDVAIGCAGVAAVNDLRGTVDAQGRELQVTEVCVADEIASAAELVMGKADGIAAAIVRGVPAAWLREGSVGAEIVRHPNEDLFR
jgi:coenzyme F420-0:L-glutamate ligase / coenzyme F420-1:gamma-L-glutamate ligase